MLTAKRFLTKLEFIFSVNNLIFLLKILRLKKVYSNAVLPPVSLILGQQLVVIAYSSFGNVTQTKLSERQKTLIFRIRILFNYDICGSSTLAKLFHETIAKQSTCLGIIDLKRLTRCKLALIFTSADHRKFLGLFWF